MRVGLALGLAAATVAVAAAAPAATVVGASLRIAYWKNESNPTPDARWTLRCNPPRGTLPRPGVACRRLLGGGPKLFLPVPPNTACTEIYGGPQRARVVGTVAGRRVWATFTRVNGCEIARWDRLSPWLLPRGGVAG